MNKIRTLLTTALTLASATTPLPSHHAHAQIVFSNLRLNDPLFHTLDDIAGCLERLASIAPAEQSVLVLDWDGIVVPKVTVPQEQPVPDPEQKNFLLRINKLNLPTMILTGRGHGRFNFEAVEHFTHLYSTLASVMNTILDETIGPQENPLRQRPFLLPPLAHSSTTQNERNLSHLALRWSQPRVFDSGLSFPLNDGNPHHTPEASVTFVANQGILFGGALTAQSHRYTSAKPHALLEVLKRGWTTHNPKWIIFIDDDEGHIEAFEREFAQREERVILIHFDPKPKTPDELQPTPDRSRARLLPAPKPIRPVLFLDWSQ